MSADLESHANRIATLLSELEEAPDSEVKMTAFELLENVDHLHRSCVWRLFELMTDLGGKGLVDRLASDPAVKMLFVLYDLIPSQPLRPVQSEVEVHAPSASAFVPLANLAGRRAAWKVAFAAEDLPPGSIHGLEIDRVPVLLVSTDGGIFAYRNACSGSVLPLHLGTLLDGVLHCPWHGCRYEARSGAALERSQASLEAFDVRVEEGKVHVAMNRSPEQVSAP